MGARGPEVVSGHAGVPRQAPLACPQDDLERLVPLVEDLQRRHAVGLVEVQVVHLEAFQGSIQAAQGPFRLGLSRLACQEQAVADRR